MLTALRISNYRSIGQDVQLDLDRLTVLVGPNGAGKSNVTDVLQFLSDAMHLGLEGAVTKRTGIAAIRRWQRSGHPWDVKIGVTLQTADVDAAYDFTLKGDKSEEYRVGRERAEVLWRRTAKRCVYEIDEGDWIESPSDLRPKVDRLSLVLPLVGGDDRFSPLADELRRMAVYDIFPDALREPHKYDPVKPMHKLGRNWASILKDQEKATWKPDLVSVLNQLTGDVEDVDVKAIGGFLTVRFRHASEGSRKKWFDAGQESNGTLRVAGILTALLQRPRPSLVAIEEPELTVHPGALELIFDYVQQATRSSQVVLTTHSPELLDLLDIDSARVVQRREGATQVSRLDAGQRDLVRKGLLSLGEVLRTEGLQPDLPLAGE